MHFRDNQTGIVFLSSVLILSLITILILSSLQGIFLYRKSLNQIKIRANELTWMEEEAKQLSFLLPSSACVIDEINPNHIISQLRNKQGCVNIRDEKNYFYLIEKLGLFSCIQSEINHQKYSTRHYRITLFFPDQNTVLQQRVAHLEPYKPCKDHTLINVLPGIQSWRYFNLN